MPGRSIGIVEHPFRSWAPRPAVNRTPKASHMWRFSLAGLLAVGGLIALFIGSFSNAAMTLRGLRAVSPATVSPATVSPATVSPATVSPATASPVASAEQRDGDAGGVVVSAASTPPSPPILTPPILTPPVNRAPVSQRSRERADRRCRTRSSARTAPARRPGSAGSSGNPCGSRNMRGRCRPGRQASGRGSSPCRDRPPCRPARPAPRCNRRRRVPAAGSRHRRHRRRARRRRTARRAAARRPLRSIGFMSYPPGSGAVRGPTSAQCAERP